jgi:hypothetical protein
VGLIILFRQVKKAMFPVKLTRWGTPEVNTITMETRQAEDISQSRRMKQILVPITEYIYW